MSGAATCSECGEVIMGPDHPCLEDEQAARDLVEELYALAEIVGSREGTDITESGASDARSGATFNADALVSPSTRTQDEPTEASRRGRSGPESRLDTLSWLTSDLKPAPDTQTHPCTSNEVSTTATPDTTDRPDAPDTEYGAVCPACDARLEDVREVLDNKRCPECDTHRSQLYTLADRRGGGR